MGCAELPGQGTRRPLAVDGRRREGPQRHRAHHAIVPVSGACRHPSAARGLRYAAGIVVAAALTAGILALRASAPDSAPPSHGTVTLSVLAARGQRLRAHRLDGQERAVGDRPRTGDRSSSPRRQKERGAVAAGAQPDGGSATARHERRVVSVLVTRQSVCRLLRRRLPEESQPGRAAVPDRVSRPPTARGGAWSADGRIVFSRGRRKRRSQS